MGWVSHPPKRMVRPDASGVRAVLLGLMVAAGVVACTPVGTSQAPPAPEAPALPPIEAGELALPAAQEASRLLQAARDSLGLGLPAAAMDLARQVMQGYPTAPGSSGALWVLARAALALGRSGEAAEAGQEYADLLGADHPAYPEAILLVARAWAEAGDPGQAAASALLLPPNTTDPVLAQARELFREVAGEVPPRDLEALVQALPPTSPMVGIGAAHAAAGFFAYGEQDAAEQWARRALSEPLDPEEEALAEGVLSGTLEESRRRPVVLGAVLPRSGVSPSLQQYAESIYEGIQVAVEAFGPDLPRPVQIEVRDDEGDAEGGKRSIQELEASEALGVVGPLTPGVLAEIADAREEPLALVSPSAFLPSGPSAGVLSLSGPDLAGSRLVARYAWDLGLESVVVLRPRTEEAGAEADAFAEAFGGLGGRIPREVVYDSGATFFQTQFDEVASILPDGLFLPLTPADIQVLAPQFTYFGLDTLGIQVLGTSGWTQDAIVMDVDSRHTDGVIASTARPSQGETEAERQFREQYETLFRKTLRTAVPALGYDAAGLLLTALRERPTTRAELLAALEGIRDFPGATGHLSVEGGRVMRKPYLVRIQDHELIYISNRFE